jgi:hypothetical protein
MIFSVEGINIYCLLIQVGLPFYFSCALNCENFHLKTKSSLGFFFFFFLASCHTLVGKVQVYVSSLILIVITLWNDFFFPMRFLFW